MADEDLYVPLIWVGLEELPMHFANQFLSQFQLSGEFIVNIGSVAPPALIGSEAEQVEQLRRMAFVRIRPIVRLALTPERMRELISVLRENLEAYEAAIGSQEIER